MLSTLHNRLIRLLRWTQAYTKTDMVYLASGSFWLVLEQAVFSLSSLALAVAFANLIPQETYGTYKYILSLAGIFGIFALPGINTALARATAQGQGAAIRAATRVSILWASMGSVAALAGSAYYFAHANMQLALALFVIAAILPIFETFTTYLSYFVGIQRFDLRAKYRITTQAVSALVLFVTLLSTHNLIALLLAYFVPLSLTRAALYWLVARTIPRSKEGFDDMRRYGLHLTAMQVLGIIANEADKILLWKFLGPAQVATYTFALAIPDQIKGPLKGVGELAFPKFAAQTPQEIRANLPQLWRKLALYALAIVCVSLIYAAAAPLIFALLFPKYLASVAYSQLYALAMVVNITAVPIAILSSQTKTTVQYALSLAQPVMTISLLFMLVPAYGIMGAITALIASRVAITAAYMGSLYTIR